MSAFTDALSHPGPLLAAFDYKNDGCVLLFQVRDRSLHQLAEAHCSAEEREPLIEQMLARKVRIGGMYATGGFTWVADESGMTVWHDDGSVASREKPPSNAAEVVLFVDRSDEGHRGVRFTLSDGRPELVCDEHDPTPGLDPAYGSDDLIADTLWAVFLGRELAVWAMVPFVDETTGDREEAQIVVARAAHAASDQVHQRKEQIAVSIGAIGRSRGLTLQVPASQDVIELRIDLPDGGVAVTTLKRGQAQQLAAYLRRVSTPRDILLAMNREIEARRSRDAG